LVEEMDLVEAVQVVEVIKGKRLDREQENPEWDSKGDKLL
jgi:hypothetical protein